MSFSLVARFLSCKQRPSCAIEGTLPNGISWASPLLTTALRTELGATLRIGVITTHHWHYGLLPLPVAPSQDAQTVWPRQVPFRFAPTTVRAPCLEVSALIVNHLLQIEAGFDLGCPCLADEFQVIVVNGHQWLLRKAEEDALIAFPSGRRTICTALGLILCFDLVSRRKLLARRVASSSFLKKLLSENSLYSRQG